MAAGRQAATAAAAVAVAVTILHTNRCAVLTCFRGVLGSNTSARESVPAPPETDRGGSFYALVFCFVCFLSFGGEIFFFFCNECFWN